MQAVKKVNLKDEQLVKQYLQGGSSSLGILYNRYYAKVYNKCLSFSRNHDDAFDMAQDVLMKAFSNIESFRGSSKFSTWLFSITQNHCINQAVKSKKMCRLDTGSAFNLIAEDIGEDDLEVRSNREELELKLNEFLNQLPDYDRKMLELKYRNDYSVKDLQSEFHLSASAVKMRLLRARQKMEHLIHDRHVA